MTGWIVYKRRSLRIFATAPVVTVAQFLAISSISRLHPAEVVQDYVVGPGQWPERSAEEIIAMI